MAQACAFFEGGFEGGEEGIYFQEPELVFEIALVEGLLDAEVEAIFEVGLEAGCAEDFDAFYGAFDRLDLEQSVGDDLVDQDGAGGEVAEAEVGLGDSIGDQSHFFEAEGAVFRASGELLELLGGEYCCARDGDLFDQGFEGSALGRRGFGGSDGGWVCEYRGRGYWADERGAWR